MKADAIDAHDYESLRAGALLYLSALLGLVIARIRAPESRPPDRLSGAMVAGVVVLGVEPLFHPIWLQWLLLSALPLVGMYLLQRALVRRGRLADGSELSPPSRDVRSGGVSPPKRPQPPAERPEPPAERPDATPAADPPDATPPVDPPPPSTPH